MSLAIGSRCCTRIRRPMPCINVQSARRHWNWRGGFSTLQWPCTSTGGSTNRRRDCLGISARPNSCQKTRMNCSILLLPCSTPKRRSMRPGGSPIGTCLWAIPRAALCERLGHVLLREDAEFHSFQMLESAFSQAEELDEERARMTLVAAARYLAAHAPTARALKQTANLALRAPPRRRPFGGRSG